MRHDLPLGPRPSARPCGVCGEPAVLTVDLTVGAGTFRKDLCEAHLSELLRRTRGARRPHARALRCTRGDLDPPG